MSSPDRSAPAQPDQRRAVFDDRERAQIREGCAAPLPPALWAAFAQFNAGDYYQCHETIEQVWRETPWPMRQCYKGLLHLAVGLYQLRRGRVVGAVAKLRSGCAYLAPFEPTCHGVDIAAVRASALRCLDAALALSPARVDAFDWSLAPRLPERP